MAASPAQALPTPDGITSQEFQEALGRYPALIQAISDTKGAKHGQQTLAELDQFRYVTAPEVFGSSQPQRPMELEDIKTLVDWKLRHGKFRPTLMKLVSSNDPLKAKNTVTEAVESYSQKKDSTQAIETLSKLRGIGPATASLLLAVHDPANVVFFADEAFWWLCCGSHKGPIKYTMKEYQNLDRAQRLLVSRLGVGAVDVERAAFVLMKHQEVVPFAAAPDDGGAGAAGATEGIDALPELVRKKVNGGGRPAAVRRKSSDEKKRKQEDSPLLASNAAAAPSSAAVENEPVLRRSKRGKRA